VIKLVVDGAMIKNCLENLDLDFREVLVNELCMMCMKQNLFL
jgi:hypothetical protein